VRLQDLAAEPAARRAGAVLGRALLALLGVLAQRRQLLRAIRIGRIRRIRRGVRGPPAMVIVSCSDPSSSRITRAKIAADDGDRFGLGREPQLRDLHGVVARRQPDEIRNGR
jgi:hypothetical protein